MNQVAQQYGLGPSSYNFLLCLAANEGASQKQLVKECRWTKPLLPAP